MPQRGCFIHPAVGGPNSETQLLPSRKPTETALLMILVNKKLRNTVPFNALMARTHRNYLTGDSCEDKTLQNTSPQCIDGKTLQRDITNIIKAMRKMCSRQEEETRGWQSCGNPSMIEAVGLLPSFLLSEVDTF